MNHITSLKLDSKFTKIYVFVCSLLLILFVASALITSYRVTQEELHRQREKVNFLEEMVKEHEITIVNQNQKIWSYEDIIDELNQTLNYKEISIMRLENTIGMLREYIKEKENELSDTKEILDATEKELEYTEEELNDTRRLLDIAKSYEERVKQGIDISYAYMLLGDYDKTKEIVSGFTDVYEPRNDAEMWERAGEIYVWIGNNYAYCSDKGFCIGEGNCAQIQYFSPDELIYYGAKDVLCGDCDDQAQLFVGMLYASGVPHDKARVECGKVPSGGHCWAGVKTGNGWYRVDPVCADPQAYIDFFGIQIPLPFLQFPVSPEDIGCFSSYNMTFWYDPEGVHLA